MRATNVTRYECTACGKEAPCRLEMYGAHQDTPEPARCMLPETSAVPAVWRERVKGEV